MAAEYLAGHKMTHHGRATEARRSRKTSATEEETQTHHLAFPAKGGLRICLVEGCPGQMATRTAMQFHFLHRHVLDTVVILEEGTPHSHGDPDATCWSPGVQ